MKFQYPNKYELHGLVRKEVYHELSGEGGDYVFVIQEVHHQNPPEAGKGNTWVRFGYYRKNHGEPRYRWGSQTTFHAPKKDAAKIIQKAIAQGILD